MTISYDQIAFAIAFTLLNLHISKYILKPVDVTTKNQTKKLKRKTIRN